MGLGPSMKTVTITGHFMDYEGIDTNGQVRFTLGDVLRNGADDQMVAPSSVVVSLVSGAFSVVIPATNDPDVIPNPFVYTVEESFAGGRTYTISVPYDTVGSLDLADLSPTLVISSPYTSAIDQTTWNALVANIDNLDAVIDQATNKILASGKYWYLNTSFASYTALNAGFTTYSEIPPYVFSLNGASILNFVTGSQTYASNASSSLASASNSLADTINPLLLIGG